MALMTRRFSTVPQADLDLIIQANHWNPFTVLGLHPAPGADGGKGWVLRAFLPEARKAGVLDLTKGEPGKALPMEKIHADGFYEAFFPDRDGPFPYRLAMKALEEAARGHYAG